MIDLGSELTAWLQQPTTAEEFHKLIRGAIRDELRTVLDGELLDAKQAAELLCMTESALRKRVERGQVPYCRVGRSLRFRRSELLASARSE